MNLGEDAVVHDNPLGANMHDNPLGHSSMLSSPASSSRASPRPARLLLPGGSAELPSSPLVSFGCIQWFWVHLLCRYLCVTTSLLEEKLLLTSHAIAGCGRLETIKCAAYSARYNCCKCMSKGIAVQLLQAQAASPASAIP